MSLRSRLLVDIGPLKRHPQFRRLWGGYVISTFGSQLTVVALPYEIFRLTGSSLAVGLMGLATIVPVFGGAVFGGSIADAMDRRTILIISQACMALSSLALYFVVLGGHPPLWSLYVLGAISAGFATLDSSSRSAVVASLLDQKEFAAGNALWQLLYQIGQIAGPALAGILIAEVSVASAFGLDALTFLASLVAVLSLTRATPGEGATKFGWTSIKEGFAFLKGRQPVYGSFIVDLNAMILGMPRALFPALGLIHFSGGPKTVGLLYSAPAVGAFAGALLTGWVTSIRRQGMAVLIAVTIWGAAIAAFGLVPWLGVALVLLAVAGGADVISAVFRGTILQSETPDGLRGRLSALHIAVVTGGPRLGDVESGAVASLAGTQFSVVSGGLGCLAGVAIAGALMPQFTHYVTPDHEPELAPA